MCFLAATFERKVLISFN